MDAKTEEFLLSLKPADVIKHDEGRMIYTFIAENENHFLLWLSPHEDIIFLKLEILTIIGVTKQLIDSQMLDDFNEVPKYLKQCSIFVKCFPQCTK